MMRHAYLVWLLCTALSAADKPGGGPFEPDAHTLALYHFDGDSPTRALDSSGRGNHGQIVGAARTDGRFGRAMRFDGVDDYVLVPDAESLKGLRQITVEAWIQPMGFGHRQFICGKNAEWHFDISEAGRGLGLSLYSHGGRQHIRQQIGGLAYTPLAWTHLAATYDGERTKFFQNGRQVGVLGGPKGYLLTSPEPLLIGTYRVMNYYLGGLIDEVRVSDCVRYDPDNALKNGQHAFRVKVVRSPRPTPKIRVPVKTGEWWLEARARLLGPRTCRGMVYVKPEGKRAVAVGQWDAQTLKPEQPASWRFDVSDEVTGRGAYCIIYHMVDGYAEMEVAGATLRSREGRAATDQRTRYLERAMADKAIHAIALDPAPPAPAGDILVRASDVDVTTGVARFMPDAAGAALYGSGGLAYYVRLPQAAAWDVWLKYASHDPRPLDATIDGADINPYDPFTPSATGGRSADRAVWERQGTTQAAAGWHGIELSGFFPNIVALLLRPRPDAPSRRLGPERGAFPAEDLLGQAAEWHCAALIGQTSRSAVRPARGKADGQQALEISYEFANTVPQKAFADDVLLVGRRVFCDVSPAGLLEFDLKGSGGPHALAVECTDAKGDSTTMGRVGLDSTEWQTVSLPLDFEGNFTFDPSCVTHLALRLDEANASPRQVSRGTVRLSHMRWVRRDALKRSAQTDERVREALAQAALIAAPRASALAARLESICVQPVVPEHYPTFATDKPQPVTRATLGYTMHTTGARGCHPDTIKRFHDDYNFGDVTWPHIGNLYAKGWQQRVQGLVKRKLFLFDFWGYVPDRNPGGTSGTTEYHISDEKHRWLLDTCGDYFLGYDDGEQDGRYISAYADKSPATTREQAFKDYYAWDQCIQKNQQYYLISTGSLNFCHYYGEAKCRMLGLETAQGLPSDTLLFGFLRGAGKQYGRLLHHGISIWSRFGYKMYHQRQVMRTNGYGNGPNKGASLSLMKRLWYVGYLYGCSIAGTETSQFTARNLPNGKRELSPIGRMNIDGLDWITRHPNRGEQYTPVAVMLDFYHGWNMPRHLYRGDRYKIWGKFPYEKPDYMIDGFFRWVWPGYEDCSYLRNERGFLTPTPLGDIFDVLLSNAAPYVLRRYECVTLLGGVEVKGELRRRLADYVAHGGDIIVCASQIAEADDDLFGVRKTGRRQTAYASKIGPTTKPLAEGAYTYDVLERRGADVLAVNERGDPLMTVARHGKGRAIVIAADFGMSDKLEYARPDLVDMEPPYRLLACVRSVLGDYFRSYGLVRVEPSQGVQYVVNVAGNAGQGPSRRLWVGLFNNDLFHEWRGTVRPVRGGWGRAVELIHGQEFAAAAAIPVVLPPGEFKIFDVTAAEPVVPALRAVEW